MKEKKNVSRVFFPEYYIFWFWGSSQLLLFWITYSCTCVQITKMSNKGDEKVKKVGA